MSEIMPPGLYNMDCIEAMKQFPDGFFDLAIVDPPYGDGNSGIGGGVRFGGWFDRYKTVEPIRTTIRPLQEPGEPGRRSTGKIIAWDVAPGKEYFQELFRVSRNQIIWGGNYFELPATRCFLVWRKLTISESFSMAMCEYAWTSFTGNAKLFEAAPQGTRNEQRFHPTQKPVKLYSWQLEMFAHPGMKILDTHAGSASSLVACRMAVLDAWGFEIDPVYYEKAKKRLEDAQAQVMFCDLL